MISAFDTTIDWQAFTGDTIILPVGSTEQHSDHLPLATDALQVTNYAREVARALDAALLPTIPYGNSLEHSGFRGSFGVSAATLMQIIRELAEEAERQNFKFLILLNGHGGNFSLGPACREWNRLDRPLKIIITAAAEFYPKDIFPFQGMTVRPEFHAGAFETSQMLHLHPDLVRQSRGIPFDQAGNEKYPLQQRDLNTYGFGQFNAGGTVGYPEHASAAAGERLIAAVLAGMIPWLKERMERLRHNSRYAGAGGILVRRAVRSDIDGFMRLKATAGWNQSVDDMIFFMDTFPDTLWVAVQNGHVIGSASAAVYGKEMAWIGMVLVDPAYRRMGIGQRLMETALAELRDVKCVKLDATPAGKRVYDKLGFHDEFLLCRLTRQAGVGAGRAMPADVRPMTAADLPAVVAADQRAFGAARPALLAALRERAPHLAWVDAHGKGFCLGRPGALCAQIGPVVAEDAATARRLMDAALHALGGGAALLDVPAAQSEFANHLAGLGFVQVRQNTRMHLRTNAAPGDPPRLFAVAGLELG